MEDGAEGEGAELAEACRWLRQLIADLNQVPPNPWPEPPTLNQVPPNLGLKSDPQPLASRAL